jgi:hypothetical protein
MTCKIPIRKRNIPVLHRKIDIADRNVFIQNRNVEVGDRKFVGKTGKDGKNKNASLTRLSSHL